MGKAIYNLPDIRRGDTWPARDIATITNSAGAPIAIASARMQIRDKKNNDTIHSWESPADGITITGNVITIAKIEASESELFTVGNQHIYDLEVTTSGGDVWTILEGKVNIISDVTNDTETGDNMAGAPIRQTVLIDHTDSPYTLTSSVGVVIAQTDGGAVDINLPANSNLSYLIRNWGSSANEINLISDEEIEHPTVLNDESLEVIFNSTLGWVTIRKTIV